MRECRAAVLFSGGKDCMYVIHLWHSLTGRIPDYLIFIRSKWESPHELNIHVVALLTRLLGRPLVLTSGDSLAATLRRLGVDILISADVYVYDHVYWLERICREADVELLEPLLNRDTYELLWDIVESNIEFIVVGVRPEYRQLLGYIVNKANVGDFAELVERLGIDPIGEGGEFHTVVTAAPLLKLRVDIRVRRVYNMRGYLVAGLECGLSQGVTSWLPRSSSVA